MKPYFLALWTLVLLLSVTSCATPRDTAWPEPRPLGDAIPAYRPPISPTGDNTPSSVPSAESEGLTLREALARALLLNPELRAFAWEVRAREARTLQAGLPPNPEIGAEMENFAGTGSLGGTDAAEVTAGFSQLIELGGDRGRRRRVAALERDLAGWNYETVRLDVLTETAQAFVGVLAAQQRLLLADSLLALAQQFYQTVSERAEAGKVSALEERRARVVLSTTQIEHERAARARTVARALLSAAWGSTTPAFERVVGALDEVEAVPDYDLLDAFVARNPDVARWREEMALRRADIALEKARRIPDPILSVGPRRIRELGETSYVAGISIPLPLFDRNQGAIQEAQYRLRQGDAGQQAAEVLARRMLADAYEQLATAYTEVTMLREDVLPAAQENFDATEEGYREGKFDLLTVLDAQRTLFETTNQYVDALLAYHQTRAEVERLIGTPLKDLSNQ